MYPGEANGNYINVWAHTHTHTHTHPHTHILKYPYTESSKLWEGWRQYTAYCSQAGRSIVSAESHYFHAASEAIIGRGNTSSLLGGFICSRVMAISQCVAQSDMPVPSRCVRVTEWVRMRSDYCLLFHWWQADVELAAGNLSHFGVKCQRGHCFSSGNYRELN